MKAARFAEILEVLGKHLRSSGHQLLATRLGPLDVLGAVGEGNGYEDLKPSTVELVVGNRTLRLLSLARLILEKERPKDLASLPALRATLEEARREPPRQRNRE